MKTARHFNQVEGYWLASGESLSDWKPKPDVDPVRQLQLTLHQLLTAFLNATDISPAYSPIPLNWCRPVMAGRVIAVLEACRAAGCEQLGRIDVELWDARAVANLLASGYLALATRMPGGVLVESVVSAINFPAWARHWKNGPLASVIAAARKINGLAGFWIHGSLATLDYLPGYSDCDATAIVDFESCTCARKLLILREKLAKIASLLHAIDPLQHHGLFIVAEPDLVNYDQRMFPLEMLTKAVEVTGKKTWFTYRDCGRGFRGDRLLFLAMCQLMRRVSLGIGRPRSSYGIKAHLQTAVLMPVIWLQLRDGRFWGKREALTACSEVVPPAIWKIVRIATKVRRAWRYKSPIPTWVIMWTTSWNPRLSPALFRAASIGGSANLQKLLPADWVHDCLRLSEYMLIDLRKRVKL